MKKFVYVFLASVLLAIPSHAGWGVNGCESVDSPSLAWVAIPDSRQLALYQNGQQIGNYSLDSRQYFSLSAGTWTAAECPAKLPEGICTCSPNCPCGGTCGGDCHCGEKQHISDLPPDGVDQKKVETGKHYHNGKECSRQHLIAALQRASVPSDANKLRLTLIGSAEVTGAIVAALEGNPEVGDFLIQQYTSDHWAVAQAGFVTNGPVTVYLQSPDGKVLHRQSDYEGGAPVLAEALREAVKSYDPTADPDCRQTDIVSTVRKFLSGISSDVWIVGGILLALLLYFRKAK